jgi:SpoVK/Ycf46/Vps4 family AAA+-type ATPase
MLKVLFSYLTASLHCMKRIGHHSDTVCLTLADFNYAMTMVQPSAMREVQLEVPKVSNNEYRCK